MTSFEKRVWRLLKACPDWEFLPQVRKGAYLLDFYSEVLCLCVEADGPTHVKTKEADAIRDETLSKMGIFTLRLTPGDFVQYTPQQLFKTVEEFASPKHRLQESET